MTNTDQRLCRNCGTLNPGTAKTCVSCGAVLVHETLSFNLAEIDERESTFRVEPDQGAAFTVSLTRKQINIGSATEQDIRLAAPGIGPYHARLKLEGINYRLFNLGSDDTVQVNKKAVQGSQILNDGDAVRLQDSAEHGVTLIYSNPVMRALFAQAMEEVYPLQTFPFSIGRDPASALKLESLAVSWHHAQITEQNGTHFLSDLNSVNGTFVNDRVIKAAYRLRANDTIRIDQTLLVYGNKALRRLSTTQAFQLDAVGLEMTYQTGFQRRRLTTMTDVSLSIRPQEFVAIIGGSGSGKSTLLRALNGVNRATAGHVLINGHDLYAHYEQYQPVIGYVPQSDIVHDNLTVYQSMWFSARLRFPREHTVARTQRIERVLDTLELKDFRDRLVGKLSGGQKKRVSIALELMAEPNLLFMDEPSSGLDPGLDKSMMDTLRHLADRGHIVIVVTHTTLHIDQCDQLALMTRGNLAFFGPPKEALTLFGVKDYSDIYNRVLETPDVSDAPGVKQTFLTLGADSLPAPTQPGSLSPVEAGKRWATFFHNSPLYARYIAQRLHPPIQEEDATRGALSNQRLRGSRQGSFLQQTRVLTDRTLALARRDARTLIMLLVVLPLIGVFLGWISYDKILNKPGQMLVPLDSIEVETLVNKLPASPLEMCNQTPGKQPDPAKCPKVPDASQRFIPYFKAIGTLAPASDAQRLMFMLALAVTLLGIFSSAYTVVAERSLFLRERMINLRISSYLAAKVIVYTGLAILSCLLLLVIISFGVRLPDRGVITWGPLELFITLALTASAGVTLGLLLSALNKQVNAVTYTVLAVLFLQILFAGILFKMDGSLEPLSRLTVTRWSLEGLGATANMPARDAEGRIVVHTQVFNVSNDPPTQLPDGIRQFPAPSAISVTYPTTADGLLLRWGALIGFSVVFLIAAGFALNRSESF